MQTENQIAFKEWASIVNALASGDQILILRKGGIREDGGDFRVEHDEFFLFPTYEHQNRMDLKPEAYQHLNFAIKTKPTSDSLPIQYYVQAVKVIQITEEAQLEDLKPFHVWSDGAVNKRFHYGREKGLFVIACRVFKLPKPHVIQVTPKYAGCKSWVSFSEKLITQGSTPVLPEADFKNQLDALNSTLVK
ncbi:MAG: DUF1802 family protein [Candidatus Omnitrophica bacterium]|nr:DUF1802 family protein [Candidatus Omnitrophota bacterium]